MVNNEFHIIGIATSNYKNIGNDRFTSYILRVEVEKMGSKFGKNFELEIQVYGTNKAIDTDIDVLGKQVAICGYLDSYTTKDGSIVNKVIAQNVYVLEKSSSVNKPVVSESSNVDIVDNRGNDVFEQVEDISNNTTEVEDDDLPF